MLAVQTLFLGTVKWGCFMLLKTTAWAKSVGVFAPPAPSTLTPLKLSQFAVQALFALQALFELPLTGLTLKIIAILIDSLSSIPE